MIIAQHSTAWIIQTSVDGKWEPLKADLWTYNIKKNNPNNEARFIHSLELVVYDSFKSQKA